MSNLILAKQIREEEYNSTVLKTENVSQFLAYYTLLLTMGVKSELVTEGKANLIAEILLNWISAEENNDPNVIANHLYLLTVYLQSMDTNVEQLNRLLKISNPIDVKELFSEAYTYLHKEVSKMKLKLRAIKMANVNFDSIRRQTNDFEVKVEEVSKLSCNFKQLHDNKTTFTCYISFGSDNSNNYITKLSKEISNFLIEIQILKTLKAKETMEDISQLPSISNSNFKESISAEEEIEEIEKEIEKLKKRYKEEIIKAEKLDDLIEEKLDEIEQRDRLTFKSMNPGIKEEDFEEAFWDWQESLPDEHFDTDIEDIDLNNLEKKYQMRLSELEDRIAQVEKEADQEVLDENKIVANIGDVTLEQILIIAAMQIEIINNPDVNFPATIEELHNCLLHLSTKWAIKILLAEPRIGFSDTERKYLEQNM